LEQYKEVALVNEEIIAKQKQEINKYVQTVINNKLIIETQVEKANELEAINKNLQTKVDEYSKQAKAWPYWLGGGFIGGIILCLSIK